MTTPYTHKQTPKPPALQDGPNIDALAALETKATRSIPWEMYGQRVPITQMIRNQERKEVLIAEDELGASLVFIAPEGKTAQPFQKGMLLIRSEPQHVHSYTDQTSSAGNLRFNLMTSEKLPGGERRPSMRRLVDMTLGSFGSPDERFRGSLAAFNGAIEGARCGLGTSISALEGFRSLADESGARLHTNPKAQDARANILLHAKLLPLIRNGENLRISLMLRGAESQSSAHHTMQGPSEVVAEVTETRLLQARRTELLCTADATRSRLEVSIGRGADKGIRYERLFSDPLTLSAYLVGFAEGFIAGRLTNKFL